MTNQTMLQTVQTELSKFDCYDCNPESPDMPQALIPEYQDLLELESALEGAIKYGDNQSD